MILALIAALSHPPIASSAQDACDALVASGGATECTVYLSRVADPLCPGFAWLAEVRWRDSTRATVEVCCVAGGGGRCTVTR